MLKGKTALITGATGGLGYAIAERLTAEGCNVVLNGLAPKTEMASTLAKLTSGKAVSSLYLQADLSDPAQIEDMMRAASAASGPLDIVVNNAVVRHFSPLEDFPVQRWNEALAVNISAAFHTIRLALPGMRAKSWGRIINMGSPYSFFAAPNRIDYITTKTALLGLTRAVAIETAGTDITCNAVCPGTLPTPAIEMRIAAIAAEKSISIDDATDQYLADKQPSGRFIALGGVAALVAFLCGPGGRDISGAALPVDSGWTAS